MGCVQHDAAHTPRKAIYAGTQRSDTSPLRSGGYIQSDCLEPTPQQKACTGNGIHPAKPPSKTLYGNSLAQGKAQQGTDDRVDRDGGGNVAVLDANQLGSD